MTKDLLDIVLVYIKLVYKKFRINKRNMGASLSTNIANIVTSAVATASSQVIQSTKLSDNQSQIISVKDVGGDVNITGNKFSQTAVINLEAMLSALATAEMRQAIIRDMAQQTKSLISGLNLAQFTDASNTLNTLVAAEIRVLNEIYQSCLVEGQQFQEIVVERVAGNVFIQNNVFDQIYNVFEKCVQSTVLNNKTLQDAIEKFEQTSSSSAQGLSEWALVAGIAGLIGIPVVGAVVGGVVALKYLFPIMLIVGLVLVGVYYWRTTTEMQLTGYSSTISKTPACESLPPNPEPTPTFQTQKEAADACLKNSKCQAFDWVSGTVQQNGIFQPTLPPRTVFYDQVSKACQAAIKPDTSRVMYTPSLFSGPAIPLSIPTAQEGDVFMDTDTTEWFQLIKDVWETKGILTRVPFREAAWGVKLPVISKDTKVSDVYFYTDQQNPVYFDVYRAKLDSDNTLKWVLDQKIPGPGLVPRALPQENMNTSGFKTDQRNSWFLYVGIAAIIIGAGGTFWSWRKKSE